MLTFLALDMIVTLAASNRDHAQASTLAITAWRCLNSPEFYISILRSKFDPRFRLRFETSFVSEAESNLDSISRTETAHGMAQDIELGRGTVAAVA